MLIKYLHFFRWVIGVVCLLLPWLARAEVPRVAFLGDSITYDGRWATGVESALRATPQYRIAEIVNFGLPSETVSGLSEPGHAGGKFPRPDVHERLDRVLAQYRPTLVIACYGMNDGLFRPFDKARFEAYQNGITRLKTTVEKSGARLIFITPPLYKADRAAGKNDPYDQVLDTYAQWLVQQRAQGWEVVDIRPDLKQAVAAEKHRSPKFVYAKDGIHPGDTGHRMIAGAIACGLWPLLQLSGTPTPAEKPAFDLLRQRQDLLKQAWLTKTGHKRPGIPKGKPLETAQAEATRLLENYWTIADKKGK